MTTTSSQPSIDLQRLLIIVATYNEIDNLPRLIRQLNEQLPQADILVIDDASPDGTGNWCEEAKTQYDQLYTIHRSGKLGLGSAAIQGFAWAAERSYDLIATMDADLSHAPESLAEMYQKMLHRDFRQVGVLIGSRYVVGGGTEGWPWTRRLASRMVNRFARLVLRLKTKDNSGAFRIYRRSALDQLDLDRMRSSDYAYLEELLWRLHRQDVTLAEHPIVFRNREHGRSKTSPLLGVKVFWQIVQMGIGLWS